MSILTFITLETVDGNTRFQCKLFYAEQFDALRKQCHCDNLFIQSLSRCISWDASGGKSGSAFLKTRGKSFNSFFSSFTLR